MRSELLMPARDRFPTNVAEITGYNPWRASFLTSPLSLRGSTMSQAVVDPSEIRRFASSLKRFNADLQSALAGLHGQLVALGDTWRDQEHDRFRAEFEQTVHVVEH